jgi:hypothetical protein
MGGLFDDDSFGTTHVLFAETFLVRQYTCNTHPLDASSIVSPAQKHLSHATINTAITPHLHDHTILHALCIKSSISRLWPSCPYFILFRSMLFTTLGFLERIFPLLSFYDCYILTRYRCMHVFALYMRFCWNTCFFSRRNLLRRVAVNEYRGTDSDAAEAIVNAHNLKSHSHNCTSRLTWATQ